MDTETAEFQKGVINAVDALKKAQSESTEHLLANYDRLDKSTKAAMEDFTKAKNAFADKKDIEEISRKMALLGASLQREQRAAWGNPIARIANDERLRRAFTRKFIAELEIAQRLAGKPITKDLDTGNTPGSTAIDNAEVERELYTALLTYGAFRNLDVRMIGRTVTEIRLQTARAAMAFVDEAVAITADSTKAGSKLTVTPKKLAGLISTSTELEEDDVVGIVQEILNDFAESLAYKLDWIGFTADGTADATDGGFSGMFYGGTNVVAATGNVTVATLDYADVLACITGVNAAVLQRGQGKWFLHPTQLARLLSILDLNGRPIFNTAIEAPSYGSIGTILGFPVVPVGAAPTANTVSSLIAVFTEGNNQAIRIRRDFHFDRSEHFAFNTDEITYRATARAASKTKIAASASVLKLAAS